MRFDPIWNSIEDRSFLSDFCRSSNKPSYHLRFWTCSSLIIDCVLDSFFAEILMENLELGATQLRRRRGGGNFVVPGTVNLLFNPIFSLEPSIYSSTTTGYFEVDVRRDDGYSNRDALIKNIKKRKAWEERKRSKTNLLIKPIVPRHSSSQFQIIFLQNSILFHCVLMNFTGVPSLNASQ